MDFVITQSHANRRHTEATKRRKDFLEEYEIVCEMFKEIIKIYLVPSKYKLTGLQYEAFLKWIPTLLPLVYGVGYYRSNIKELHKLLGANHKKRVSLLIGAKRDGKSAVVIFAVLGMFLRVVQRANNPNEQGDERLASICIDGNVIIGVD